MFQKNKEGIKRKKKKSIYIYYILRLSEQFYISLFIPLSFYNIFFT